jgi:hypothetical protein
MRKLINFVSSEKGLSTLRIVAFIASFTGSAHIVSILGGANAWGM